MGLIRDLIGNKARQIGPSVDAPSSRRSGRRSAAGARGKVERARGALRALKLIVVLDGHSRHAAALGGQRVAGVGQLLSSTSSSSRAAFPHSSGDTVGGMFMVI